MFGRRRGRRDSEEQDQDLGQDYGQADDEYDEDEDGEDLAEDGEQGPEGEQIPPGEPRADGGPWDSGEPYPPMERVDLGSLRIPVGAEYDIQLVMADQHGAWIMVHHGNSDLQLQAFAAPRRDSLWDDVRAEIAAEVAGAGGKSEEQEGPFGSELVASVPAAPDNPELRPVRFVGVDGPRWFLRGLFSGDASCSQEAAAPLEALLRQIVVARGDHPVPPRDLLELRLPAEAAKALAEEQARAQQEGRFQTPLNPFERGPEFTETR